MEKQGLWYRALLDRYGDVEGVLGEGGRGSSLWWRDVNLVDKGIWGFRHNWLWGSMLKVMGNCADTNFWHDPWVGEGTGVLKNRFIRLASLANDIGAKVAEVRVRGVEGWQRSGVGGEDYFNGKKC